MKTHVLKRDVCCNENCFAPSCFCKTHRIQILDASETYTVGHMDNIFPGDHTHKFADFPYSASMANLSKFANLAPELYENHINTT
jgi:hypothetical protein